MRTPLFGENSGVAIATQDRDERSAMSDVTFYRCNKCGNLVMVVKRGTGTPQCCGEPMEELVPGSVDAAGEKHVPVVANDGEHLTVRVGEVEHPMLDAHYIEWIALAAEGKTFIKHLKPGDAPEARFCAKFSEHGVAYE
jgi:superoxide reductase